MIEQVLATVKTLGFMYMLIGMVTSIANPQTGVAMAITGGLVFYLIP
jgi:hypothetical protein